MTNEQIKQFYIDLGKVCRKHNIEGVAGIWFSGDGHDEYGNMLFYPPHDSRMKVIIEGMHQRYEQWAKETLNHTPKPLGEIKEILSDGNGSEKN